MTEPAKAVKSTKGAKVDLTDKEVNFWQKFTSSTPSMPPDFLQKLACFTIKSAKPVKPTKSAKYD